MSLVFCCPGTPHSTPSPGGTVMGLERAHAMGLRGMEIEWVQNVPTNIERMAEIRATAERLGMTLTVHAPYFVNLNTSEAHKLEASKHRIIKALSMAQLCGAVSVCVHAAFYGKSTSEQATENVRRATEEILRNKKKLFPDVNLAYETMGKPSQWGTLTEVLTISKEFDLYPCVDTAHMHARSNGKDNSAKEWNAMLDSYAKALGTASLKSMHLHYSGIAYGPKGEKNHLPFKKSDANWQEFMRVLKDRNVGGALVCESPLMELDTLLLKNTYEAI